jgi:protease IV
MRRSRLLAVVLCLAAAVPAAAQLVDYPTESLFLPQTPGVTAGALGGLFNPAALGVGAMGRSELAGWMRDLDDREDWGVSTSGLFGPGAFGLGVFSQDDDTIWQLGTSGGNRAARAGFAYRWGPEDALLAGLLLQPRRELSLGASGTWSMDSSARQGVFDLGLRPLGTPLVTLYADYTLERDTRFDEGRWAAGVSVRPLRGLVLGAAAREMVHGQEPELLLHAGITSAGFLGLDYIGRGDGDGQAAVLRVNPPSPGLDVGLAQRSYAVVDLEHKVVAYQKFRWLDDRRVAWLDLLRLLDAIAADPHVDGVVVNLADTAIRPSLAWELRQSLQELKGAGKEVVVHANRLDFLGYYLASVADRLVVDPEGDVVLQGVALRRTYLKGTLEKMGIGFQELRYFTYKSAMETFSRSDMSAADREQRQRVVEVIYETVRAAVCESRKLTPAQFDALVDGELGFWPQLAKDRGLVDDIGRWQDVQKWVRKERGRSLGGPSPAYVAGAYPESQWGEPKRIAVVYAVGECAMDTGIKGRATSDYLLSLAKRHDVAGVVLRADSPGGDPLPSDLVAGAVRTLRERGIPVIVSQGDVAASGGYWISMDGEKILTTPLTLTGSIGVIGGWFWNDGIGEKTGLTSDGVQMGRHADLMTGLRFPLVGTSLPVRGLDEQELGLARGYVVQAYDEFVGHVARGRKLPEESVRGIAEGRVWMGEDALARGLCDQLGSLRDAIDLVRDRAGIPDNREVVILEYPPRQLIDFSALVGGSGGLPSFPFGLRQPFAGLWSVLAADTPAAADLRDYVEVYLQTLAANPGRGAVILSPDDLPEGWREQD